MGNGSNDAYDEGYFEVVWGLW